MTDTAALSATRGAVNTSRAVPSPKVHGPGAPELTNQTASAQAAAPSSHSAGSSQVLQIKADVFARQYLNASSAAGDDIRAVLRHLDAHESLASRSFYDLLDACELEASTRGSVDPHRRMKCVKGAHASVPGALSSEIQCSRDVGSPFQQCIFTNVIVYRGVLYLPLRDRSLKWAAIQLPEMKWEGPPSQRESKYGALPQIQAVWSGWPPFVWEQQLVGAQVVDHAVVLSREHPGEAYTTLTEDIANAHWMLCSVFSDCGRPPPTSPSEASASAAESNTSHAPAHTPLRSALSAAAAAAAATPCASAPCEGGVQGLSAQGGSRDAAAAGSLGARSNSLVILADGTRHAAARVHDRFWSCLTPGQPYVVTDELADRTSRDTIYIVKRLAAGLGPSCRGDYWCSAAVPVEANRTDDSPDRTSLSDAVTRAYFDRIRTCNAAKEPSKADGTAPPGAHAHQGEATSGAAPLSESIPSPSAARARGLFVRFKRGRTSSPLAPSAAADVAAAGRPAGLRNASDSGSQPAAQPAVDPTAIAELPGLVTGTPGQLQAWLDVDAGRGALNDSFAAVDDSLPLLTEDLQEQELQSALNASTAVKPDVDGTVQPLAVAPSFTPPAGAPEPLGAPPPQQLSKSMLLIGSQWCFETGHLMRLEAEPLLTELRAALPQWNVTTLDVAGQAVPEQAVAAASRASVVVAMHDPAFGVQCAAGAAHALFMQPGGALVLITPTAKQQDGYGAPRGAPLEAVSSSDDSLRRGWGGAVRVALGVAPVKLPAVARFAPLIGNRLGVHNITMVVDARHIVSVATGLQQSLSLR